MAKRSPRVFLNHLSSSCIGPPFSLNSGFASGETRCRVNFQLKNGLLPDEHMNISTATNDVSYYSILVSDKKDIVTSTKLITRKDVNGAIVRDANGQPVLDKVSTPGFVNVALGTAGTKLKMFSRNTMTKDASGNYIYEPVLKEIVNDDGTRDFVPYTAVELAQAFLENQKQYLREKNATLPKKNKSEAHRTGIDLPESSSVENELEIFDDSI